MDKKLKIKHKKLKLKKLMLKSKDKIEVFVILGGSINEYCLDCS